MELDQLLERTTESTGRIIAGVTPEQLSAPTPCSDWAVRDVLNHIIGGNFFFAKVAAGEKMEVPSEPRDLVGDDPAGIYAEGD